MSWSLSRELGIRYKPAPDERPGEGLFAPSFAEQADDGSYLMEDGYAAILRRTAWEILIVSPEGETRAETPQNRGSEGGNGRIGVSACREGGSGGKGSGKVGDFRLDQVTRLGTIAT